MENKTVESTSNFLNEDEHKEGYRRKNSAVVDFTEVVNVWCENPDKTFSEIVEEKGLENNFMWNFAFDAIRENAYISQMNLVANSGNTYLNAEMYRKVLEQYYGTPDEISIGIGAAKRVASLLTHNDINFEMPFVVLKHDDDLKSRYYFSVPEDAKEYAPLESISGRQIKTLAKALSAAYLADAKAPEFVCHDKEGIVEKAKSFCDISSAERKEKMKDVNVCSFILSRFELDGRRLKEVKTCTQEEFAQHKYSSFPEKMTVLKFVSKRLLSEMDTCKALGIDPEYVLSNEYLSRIAPEVENTKNLVENVERLILYVNELAEYPNQTFLEISKCILKDFGKEKVFLSQSEFLSTLAVVHFSSLMANHKSGDLVDTSERLMKKNIVPKNRKEDFFVDFVDMMNFDDVKDFLAFRAAVRNGTIYFDGREMLNICNVHDDSGYGECVACCRVYDVIDSVCGFWKEDFTDYFYRKLLDDELSSEKHLK